jgi:hypothetical protein
MGAPARVAAMPAKVVVRYLDGRVVKGTTLNFNPTKPRFLLRLLDAPGTDEPVGIALTDLKAVFFVRDFAGVPDYNEKKQFESAPRGRRLAVRCVDGETLVGATLTYDATREGFFLFPADPKSNNERIYVLAKAVAKVETI